MRVSSVSDFVLQIRTLVERNIPLGWIGGEVSNLVYASSGHVYFILKDERAQIRCAMWRNRAQLLGFRLTEGMRVEVRAQATVYESRGDLQLAVDSVRRAGLGSLFEAYLRLKKQLEAEGLFDAARKRAVPLRPRGIALVTSASGAVLHDVMTVLRRRAPALPITIYPCLVQGDQAPAQITGAIQTACSRAAIDGTELMLVCRGGGSMEDLWSFNHESVVRAIASSPLPVICGVGHETDTTLADFAADLRAPTPSAAAELASAGWFALRERMPSLKRELQNLLGARLQHAWQEVDQLGLRLKHPSARLLRSRERMTGLARQVRHLMHARMRQQALQLGALGARLGQATPETGRRREKLGALESALNKSIQMRLAHAKQTSEHLSARLENLNPAAVLARGYAIVRNGSGVILRDAERGQPGETLDIELARGRLKARIERP